MLLTTEFTDANGVTDPVLNLANLSRLYRIASFARALKVSIRDFVALKVLTGIVPFADGTSPATSTHTANTLRFVETARKVRRSGFQVMELDYLLRHRFEEKDGIAPSEENVAQILTEIRADLQKIAADTVVVSDPTGEVTRKSLLLLKWDNWVVEEAIAILNGSKLYSTTLAALPADLNFLDDIPEELKELKEKISYDATIKELRFTGPMTVKERNALFALSSETTYQAAIKILFDAPRGFVAEKMKAFEVPPSVVSLQFSTNLDALPTGLAFPVELKDQILFNAASHQLQFVGLMAAAQKTTLLALAPNDAPYQAAINALYLGIEFPKELQSRIYYDPATKELRFIGWMTAAEKASLLELSDNLIYQAGINALFEAPGAFVPDAGNLFLKDSASDLFDADTPLKPATAEDRFAFVLSKLLPYIRRVLGESLVKQKLGDALKLEAEMSNQLLTQWVNSPKHPDQKSIAEFLAPVFAESNLNVKLTAAAFLDQFDTYTLLHKIGMLVGRFRFTPEQARWVFEYGPEPEVGWLDPQTLPYAHADIDPKQFARWERLVDLFALRDQLPLGEAVLSRIFALARIGTTTKNDLLHELSARIGWDEENLKFLDGAQGFGLVFPTAYRDERALRRLKAAVVTLKRLGVSASQVLMPGNESANAWTSPNMTALAARSIKQAVKAKYGDEQWLTVAKALKDILREKQRSALVSFLVFNLGKDDANDLFAHFLVDVEMSPCAMTSRIKQAHGSVQLFVQRCLLGLEKDAAKNTIAFDEETARQWKWRKNYRVWEANRKVFLYPENWIEPELRDDKSPFFRDLESQLLQNEITKDTAEGAFLTYLERLNDVARLEVVGMYHQMEGVPKKLSTVAGEAAESDMASVTLDILHVFARTAQGTPRIYYYRRRVGSSRTSYRWTPWEKVDVDIEGDHLIPVVWNRRVHVFWPVFTEKAEGTIPPAGQSGEEPVKHLEIQIAWSEYKNGKWSAKKVSAETLPLPPEKSWNKNYLYFRGLTPGNLELRCYWADLLLVYRPIREFLFAGCEGSVQLKDVNESSEATVPSNTHAWNMMLGEGFMFSDDALYIPRHGATDTPVLKKTPGAFRLLLPHQDRQFESQRPFFFQDDTRTFFIAPVEVTVELPGYFMLENAGDFITLNL